MKRRWLAVVVCINVIELLSVHSVSLDFPNIPTKDDHGIVVGTSSNPNDDDITDDGPAAPLKITHLRVRSEIALRYARTAIVSNVYNPSKRPQEATFHMLLPDTAFISGFTMTLGKETYEAYVKEKEEAKHIYDDAVAQGVSAAHVASKARDSNHFTIKFNLEGRTNATYLLRYEEFLVRRQGVYNHAINLLPGALVPKMDVVIHIKESQKISVLRVPELRTGNEIDATDKDTQNANAVINRGHNEKEATITFTPDLSEQKRLAEIYAEKIKRTTDPDYMNIGYDSREEVNETLGLLGQFVVQYDVDQPNNGEILVNDGYFVHFYAPRSLPPLSKHVVFVLDTSGSMRGSKISQLITAMNAILSDLNPNDHFSIIEFNSYVKVHSLNKVYKRPDSLRKTSPVVSAIASPENIAAAKMIVSGFRARGGTDIYDALDIAMNIIHNMDNQTDMANNTTSEDDVNGIRDKKYNNLEPIIIFLTDGAPTEGETDINRIITFLSEKNNGEKQAPLFSLAFGDDADRVFLRTLSLRNAGLMRHIYEAADAALQLHDFYRQVSSPLLADVRFLYPRKQIKEGSVSRSQFRTINDGSEVAVVGKIAEDVNEITPQVRGFKGDGVGHRKLYEINTNSSMTREKNDHLPLERLWAYLTIKQLLDKRDAGDDSQGDDTSSEDSPEQKALAIALQYSFVTPLTSLVVVRLNKTDVVEAVNAETVDQPSFLPRSLMSASLPMVARTYKGYTSDGVLSVVSSDGPVMFASSTRRFASGQYDSDDYYGNLQKIFSGTDLSINRWTCSECEGRRFAPDVYGSGVSDGDLVGVGDGDSGGGGGGGSNRYDGSSGILYDFPSHSDKEATKSLVDGAQTINSPLCPGGRYPNVSQIGSYVCLEKILIELSYEDKYHLEDFEWTSALYREGTDSLMFDVNGTEVVLQLTNNIDPPKQDEGDMECNSKTLTTTAAVGVTDRAGSVCVYITRCFAARNITVSDYRTSYCLVNNQFAGICCPKSEVDKRN